MEPATTTEPLYGTGPLLILTKFLCLNTSSIPAAHAVESSSLGHVDTWLAHGTLFLRFHFVGFVAARKTAKYFHLDFYFLLYTATYSLITFDYLLTLGKLAVSHFNNRVLHPNRALSTEIIWLHSFCFDCLGRVLLCTSCDAGRYCDPYALAIYHSPTFHIHYTS